MDTPVYVYSLCGGTKPEVETRTYEDDTYSLCSRMIRDLAESLERMDHFEHKLKHDLHYPTNKFLCSIYVLDIAAITKYLPEVSLDTLIYGAEMIAGFA